MGKAILPVLVADGVNLNLLTAPLNEIQGTDYRGCDKGSAFALIKCIHTAPANPPLPGPLPAPPRVPVSYLNTLTERIDSRETWRKPAPRQAGAPPRDVQLHRSGKFKNATPGRKPKRVFGPRCFVVGCRCPRLRSRFGEIRSLRTGICANAVAPVLDGAAYSPIMNELQAVALKRGPAL